LTENPLIGLKKFYFCLQEKPDKLTDRLEKIIKGCIAGDSHCQEELYMLLSPGMYALCLQYASDADEANDFLQEGFIRVFTKISSYRWEGSFEGWVRKIIVNTALQMIRKKKQMFVLNEELTEDASYEVPAVQGELDKEDLLMMIRNLPVNQRIVFNLFVIEGYNHSEIAKLTGMPENTSKSHLHRARTGLKEMINLHWQAMDKKSKKNV
jgi:RNA polymerase sigma factor (sigma-70 family)